MAHQTFPKPTSRPKAKNRTVTKRRQSKRRNSEAVKRYVYELVDARDRGHDRVMGGFAGFNLQHHHIVPRSRGGQHETHNIISVSRHTHDLIHAKRIIVTGNADRMIYCREMNSEGKCIGIWSRDMTKAPK